MVRSIIVGMAVHTDPLVVRQRIGEIVRSAHAAALVAAYFDKGRGFAGAMFDGVDESQLLSDNPFDRFTVDDVVAASLLDVRFGPTAVRALLGRDDIQEALANFPEAVPLWETTTEDLGAATHLWDLLRNVDGIGRTRASKLLARKRPHTLPIVDSVISAALQLRADTWRPLATALGDEHLRNDIENLRPALLSKGVSLLRLLDVATWMTCSRGTAAVQVQIEVGAPPMRALASRH